MKKQIISVLWVLALLLSNVSFLQATVLTFSPNEGMPFAIPDNTPAGITRTYTVSGVPGGVTVNSATLTLQFSVTHTWAGDLTATLTSPDTETHTLFARLGQTGGTGAGFSSDLTGPYTLSDAGATTLWTAASSAGTVPSGTYRTTSLGANTATSMNTTFGYPGLPFVDRLLGKSNIETKKVNVPTAELTNGTWSFTISDNASGDTGTISVANLAIDFVAPTAANASIKGRLVTPAGNGVSNALVVITNTTTGEAKSVQSSSFGNFSADDLPIGDTYVIQVVSRKYQFPIHTIQLQDNISDMMIEATE